MNSVYLYFLIFVCIAYLIVTDENIAALINYSSRMLRIQCEKVKWIILNDPRNPIVRYLVYKKSLKMAEELIKEFENKKSK